MKACLPANSMKNRRKPRLRPPENEDMRLVRYELPWIVTVVVAWFLGRWFGQYFVMPLAKHPLVPFGVLLIGVFVIGTALRYRPSFKGKSGYAASSRSN